MSESKPIMTRVSERLLKRFDEALENDGLNRSDVVKKSIIDYVEKYENRKEGLKMKAYRNAVDDVTLVIAEDMIQPEGVSIAEECYPGFWSFGHGSEPKFEMIPVSHDFFDDAEKVSNLYLGRSIEYSDMTKKEIENEFIDMISKIK